MEPPLHTALVFNRDGDLSVFESFIHATNWIEAIDVDDGEYTAVYSTDGGVLTLTAPEGPEGSVVLSRTDSVDLDDLQRRVASYWRRHEPGQPSRDPQQTARYLIDRDSQPRTGWLRRIAGWPRRDHSGEA